MSSIKAIGIATILGILAGCDSFLGFAYEWIAFKPTGQVYVYDGKRYDVYDGVAEADDGDDVTRITGLVLFPEGTSAANRVTENIAAVCWRGETNCETEFGKQLRGNKPAERAEGMGY